MVKASHVHDLLAWHLAEKTSIKSSSFVTRKCMPARVANTWYHASSWAIHREDVGLGDGSIFFRTQWHDTEQDVCTKVTKRPAWPLARFPHCGDASLLLKSNCVDMTYTFLAGRQQCQTQRTLKLAQTTQAGTQRAE